MIWYDKIMKTKTTPTAQDIQNEIFRKMPANESFKIASDFSMFLIKLNKVEKKKNGFSKTNRKNRRNS